MVSRAKKIKTRIDFWIILGFFIIAISATLSFEVNVITSAALFFILPSVYLLLREAKQIKRLSAVAFVGVIITFIAELIGEFNGAWSEARVDQLLFPNKLFDVVPIDALIIYFFWIIFVISYYEHFFEHDKSEKVSPRFKIALLWAFGILILTLCLFFFYPNTLIWPYTFLIIGLIIASPLLYLITIRPRLLGKFSKAMVFNAFVLLAFELVGLKLGHWRYPGQFPGDYIGTVSLFGLSFAFEELVFWIVLGAPTLFAYYELCIDDEV